MRLSKKQISNTLFIISICILLFTPLGFKIKVQVSRLFAISAVDAKEEDQVLLKNYTWKLVDLNGFDFDFESLRKEVVLVNFWATWCPPCVAEMPSMQNLYNDYSGKMSFVFVAKDDYKAVNEFLKKEEYNFPVYYSKSEEPKVLNSKLLPTTYIIDKKGKIRVVETGAVNWNSKSTRELLDRLISE